MKRPPAVTSSIVVLSAFIVVFVISFVAELTKGPPLAAVAGFVYIILHLLPLIGVILRRNWGRIWTITVLIVWGLAFIGVGIYMLAKRGSWPGLAIELMVSGLLFWQVVALLKTETKNYFSSDRFTDIQPESTG